MPALTRLADALLDRAVVPGYSKVGPALRRRWWPADPAPGSMAGRRVLVTGATSGIGTAIAEGLLGLGATVHVLGRDRAKTDDLVARLERGIPGGVGGRGRADGARVVAEVCDVGDLDAVRTWAEEFTGRVDELHGLVHNAGTLPAERSETAQGHELTLAVHVLSPHLMTALLTDVLSPDAAVVWMSSGGMYGAGLRADDLEFTDGEYSGVRAYARTKRMQVVLAAEWARRLPGRHVYSTHPGWVATDGVTASIPAFGKVMAPLLRTPADGADTTVWLLATRPASRPPHFWHDRAQRPSTLGWERGQDPGKVRRFLDQVATAADVPG
ncbi:SDR family oxidoreductase [Klenkia marina]|uniref:SDR family oxidoreductase n=1 Tax=Klenkia marina TaxID=1960309 RepID=UPI001A9D2264|nr:SDR family NAD(P)-dependent oxidoreductase [Klenkia marina]